MFPCRHQQIPLAREKKQTIRKCVTIIKGLSKNNDKEHFGNRCFILNDVTIFKFRTAIFTRAVEKLSLHETKFD